MGGWFSSSATPTVKGEPLSFNARSLYSSSVQVASCSGMIELSGSDKPPRKNIIRHSLSSRVRCASSRKSATYSSMDLVPGRSNINLTAGFIFGDVFCNDWSKACGSICSKIFIRHRQNQTGKGQRAKTGISEAGQRSKQYKAEVGVTGTGSEFQGRAVRGQTQR